MADITTVAATETATVEVVMAVAVTEATVMAVAVTLATREDMVAVMEAIRVDGPGSKEVVAGRTIKCTLEMRTFHQVNRTETVVMCVQNTSSATTTDTAGNFFGYFITLKKEYSK